MQQMDVLPGVTTSVLSQLAAQQLVSDAFESIFADLQRAAQSNRDLQVGWSYHML